MRLLRSWIAPLARIASKDPSNSRLNGIRIRRDQNKVEAVSSDKKRLLCVRSSDDPDCCDMTSGCEALVEAKSLSDAARATRKAIPKRVHASNYVAITESTLNGTAEVCAGLEGTPWKATAMCIDAPFPCIDSIVQEPDPQACTTIRLDPRLIGELLIAIADVSDAREPVLDLHVPHDRSKAVYALLRANGIEAIGVCMPILVEEKQDD